MKKKYVYKLFFTFIGLLLLSPILGADYYWVEGSGNWSDLTHWATTSGGTTKHRKLPTISDNVIFDANSGFIAGSDKNRVTIDQNEVYCYNMEWRGTGTNTKPTLTSKSGAWGYILIYGSLTLESGMTCGNVYPRFVGTGKHTIKTAGVSTPDLYFNSSGTWTLQDALNVRGDIAFNKGTLNTNNQGFSMRSFGTATYGTDVRRLILGSSTITVRSGWSSERKNMVIEPGTSHFIFTNSVHLGSQILFYPGQRLNKVTVNESPSGGILSFGVRPAGEIFIDELILNESTSLSSNITTKKTTLRQGKQYSFNYNTNLKITESFVAVGSKCDGLIRVKGNENQTTSKITLSPTATINAKGWAVSSISLSKPITLNESFDYGKNQNITFNTPVSKTLYWVGGEGNWSDKTHWSTVNNGVFPAADGGCLPGPNDNVIFNNNSGFTTQKNKVKVDVNAYCHDMTWTNTIANTPEISTIYRYQQSQKFRLTIGGSLTLQPNMKYLVRETHLVSNEAETITTNGLEVGDNTPLTTSYDNRRIISFQMNGKGGNWRLQDPFIGNVSMSLYNGSFYTNNHNMRLHSFAGGAYYDRNTLLALGTSQITLTTKNYRGSSWSFGGTNSTSVLQAENSTIIFLSEKAFFIAKKGDKYNIVSHTPSTTEKNPIMQIGGSGTNDSFFVKKLTLKGDGSFNQSSIIDELILEGKQYEFYPRYLTTINKKLQAKTSSCNEKMSLSRREVGSNDKYNFDVKATATLDVSNLIVSNMKAITPLSLANSIDDGNNENVTFPLGVEKTYYWVGGAGDWSDTKHWSLTSGGTYPSTDVKCVPTVTTNVVFDANSGFTTTSNTVVYNGHIYCNDMKWEGAKSNPIFKRKDDAINKTALNIYGSLTLQKNMKLFPGKYGQRNYHTINFKSNKQDEFIKTNGNEISHSGGSEPRVFRFYFKGAGAWKFLDDFDGKGVVVFPNTGTLDFNNKKIQISALYGTHNNNISTIHKLKLGSSLVEIYGDSFYSGTWRHRLTLENTNSTIIFKNHGKMDMPGKKTNQTVPDTNNQYTNIIFEKGGTIEGQLGAKKIVFKGNANLYASFDHGVLVVVDTLMTASKGDFTMSENSLLQVNKRAYFSGSPCNTKKIQGGGKPGSFPKLNILAGTTKFASITMQGIDASGSHKPVTIVNGNDLGNNTNVKFITEDLGTIGGLGPDVTNLTDFSSPYVVNTNRFYTNPNAKIVWGDGSVGDTFSVTKSGVYKVAVTYDDGCYVTDKIIVRTKNPTPVFGCVREGDTFVSGTGFNPGIIKLTTPSGKTVSTTVKADNTWSVAITTPLNIGNKISAVQNINNYDSAVATHNVAVNTGEPKAPVANSATNAPNGTINITEVTGYEYSFNNGAFTTKADYSNLSAGTYTVTARLVASPLCTSKTTFHIGTDTPPAFNCVRADETQVTGTGEPNAIIALKLTDGTTKNTTVQADKTWTITGVTLVAGNVISATQKIGVFPPSSAVNYTVVGAGEPKAPTGTITNAPNGSITITPTSGYEYSFNGGAYANTTTFTGLKEGNYSVTARLANSPLCVSTPTTFSVGSNIPSISPAGLSLCIGNSQKLTASIPGGVWTSSSNAIATVDNGGNVVAKSTGSTQITYTVNRQTTTAYVQVISGGASAELILTPQPTTSFPINSIYDYKFNVTDGSASSVLIDAVATGLPSGLTMTKAYTTSTIAGATAGTFAMPIGSAMNNAGEIFVVSMGDGSIKKVATDGTVSQFVTGLQSPVDIDIDPQGNLYVSERVGAIKKITSAGVVSTITGGTQSTRLAFPISLVYDNTSSNLYVSEAERFRIIKIAPNGTVSTLAGSDTQDMGDVDGKGTNARFTAVYEMTIDNLGNLYVGDIDSQKIKKITPAGVVTTIASNIIAMGLAVDSSNNIYVTKRSNNKPVSEIVKINAISKQTTPLNISMPAVGIPIKRLLIGKKEELIVTDSDTNQIKKITQEYTISSNKKVMPSGTYSYTLTAQGVCGPVSKKVAFTVGSVCKPIIGSTSICEGSTNKFTATTTGGVWSSSDTNIATVDTNGLVTGVKAGAASITYAVSGCNENLSITVNAKPKFTISKSNLSCFEKNPADGWIKVTAAEGKAPFKFLLYKNGVKIKETTIEQAINTPYEFSGLEKGVYKVLIMDANGCVQTEYTP